MADTLLFPLWKIGRLRMATDGKGVTALVCAQGCPLDCKHCINPQSKPFDCENRVSPEQLYDIVKKDGLYYSATGGGVTFGGGEPLLYTMFIAQFRKIIPAEWHIYAESSLMIPEKNVYEAADATDHFFIDVKDTNPEIYKAYTGGDNKTVLSNLSVLIKTAGADRITARVPLIPGYNTDKDRERSVLMLAGMGITEFDLFKYKTVTQKENQ